MKGGHNRKSVAAKRAAGTYRADRARKAPVPSALVRWPDPPRHFVEPEKVAWDRLGDAVMSLGVVSVADLLFCERVAQVSARVDTALADEEFKPTALNALLKLEADLRKQLGLSPQARGSVDPLAPEQDEEDEDPDAEFGPGA